MAAKVLNGEAKASEIPFEICEGASLYINTEAAEKIGFEFSDEAKDGAEEVFDTIVVE